MADEILKGAKGGSGDAFKQTPDNLRSDDTFEGVLGLAIGPLKGPVGGLKGVKVNGTAVENATGERNYGDFVVIVGDGDPAKFPQKVQLKLGAGAAPTSVGLEFETGTWITRTLTNTGADFIDLRFIVNQLFKQTEKGIYENAATIEVQLKPTGKATWIDPTLTTIPQGSRHINLNRVLLSLFDGTSATEYYGNNNPASTSGFRIKGKTTAPSVHELRIDVPNTGPYTNVQWDVRARLIEPASVDDGNGNIQKRTITWESIAGVYSTVLGDHEDWRGVAWMQVYGKASSQLTGVPEMTGVWDTKIVNVPPSNVYNPTTRQYTGTIWDGSWSKAFTNDPAWVVNDAISDSLSGLALIAQGSHLNKWDALDASKWASWLVPDGAGGFHPRYSLNISMAEPQKAEDFIRYLAGAMGGLAWDQGDGEWRMRVDKPETPVDIFTLETIEGEFSYSHTDVDTRYNDITMAFKNAEMDYREDRVRLYDNDHIARFGRKPTTMVAVGCTHRQEAMRRTKLRLESTTGETRIVNFSTNRRGRNVNQLDMILVADGDLGDAVNRSTGRTVAVSLDRKTITLRDTVRLEIGVAYTLNFSSKNPNYNPEITGQPTNATWRLPTIAQTRNITNGAGARGNVTVLTLDVALPADIPDNLSISLSATNLPTLPKLYRVLNVMTDESGERIGISALEVNTAKWDLSDNVTNEDTVFQDLRGIIGPPTLPISGTVLSLVTVGPGLVNLMGNFQRPSEAYVAGFNVRYRVNDGQWVLLSDKITQPNFELVNPVPGTYDFQIRSIDRMGNTSLPLVASTIITQELLDAASLFYADGSSIQSLQPSQPGATAGAPIGTDVGGVAAGDVADATNNFNQRLNRLGTPITPAIAGAAITHIPNPDGTVDILLSWDWDGDENTIDAFAVTYRVGQVNEGRGGTALAGAEFFGSRAQRQS